MGRASARIKWQVGAHACRDRCSVFYFGSREREGEREKGYVISGEER